jgi:glycosyltransferase involved in cell wall biosynthesis
VSVVICTYTMDLYEDAREAADAVLEQTYDDIELVLVSDGSDDVCRAMRSDFEDREDVVVECHAENRGLSASRNSGVDVATGDVVAFVDDDAVPERSWVEHLVDGYERHDALAVGGKTTPIWVAEEPEFLPEEFYWLIGVTHRGYPEEECEVRNTNGSNMSFRREVLEELGGFDEQLGRKGGRQIQGEETEFAARLYSRYGERMMYLPDAEVGHKVFEYRTRRSWLVRRAFWQGYSKQVMNDLVQDGIDEEGRFLRRLTYQSLPQRIRGLLRSPSVRKGDQLLMLVALTAAVGFGFLYAFVRR